MRFLVLILVSAGLLTGCYRSLVVPGGGGGGGGGTPGAMDAAPLPAMDGGISTPVVCGTELCDADRELCCDLCLGERACSPSATGCPDIDCPPGDCESNADCDDGAFCSFATGACTADGGGVCEDRPRGCDDDCPGVCGCDGRTYCNECVAASEGINVVSLAACELGCGPGGPVCSEPDYCDLGPGCGRTGEFSCQPRPRRCPPDGDPVCGCDGEVYANDCLAMQAGITVNESRECDEADRIEEICDDFCEEFPARCGFPIDEACPAFCLLFLSACSDAEVNELVECLELDCAEGVACIQDVGCF